MHFLLDTQIALWWLTASPRLRKPARALVAESPCTVSVASIWEVELKHRLGKLPVPAKRFKDELESAGAAILPVTGQHVLTHVQAAQQHRDPFDRLLLSVAMAEGLILLTADEDLIRLHDSNDALPIRAT